MINSQLPFTVFASENELVNFQLEYGVDMRPYFNQYGECTILLHVIQLAENDDSEIFIPSDSLFQNLLMHEERRGTRLILLEDGAVRYTSKLGKQYPNAKRIRSFIPTQMFQYLTTNEFDLLSNEIKINNPATNKAISVLDISSMSVICDIYESALRFKLLKNTKQIEIGILMRKLKNQFTIDSIKLKIKELNNHHLSNSEQVQLYAKPRTLVKASRLYKDNIYEAFARLRGNEFDKNDPRRYQKNAAVMTDIDKIGYSFITNGAKRSIRTRKNKPNVRFGNCLNQNAMAIVNWNLTKSANLANMYFEKGQIQEFHKELNEFQRDYIANALAE